MIEFDCPSCRRGLEADLAFAGETIECPSCRHPAVVPATAIARGSVIAGYRIERHLGGGSLGEVYEATQLSVDRRVALKILPPILAQHAVLTAAFLREARSLARVNHPGVVAVLDAGSDTSCFYLTTPLIEGEDMARRVERQGRLTEAEAVHVALEIARVLSSCWDRFAMAHLDLKPANIMVDTDGHVRLLDFGLTGHLFRDPDNLRTTRHLLITPFVSPEQLEGRTELDFHCDLYALGACLYFLTTGRNPYQETVADELVKRVLNQQLPPARKANPDLSAPFDQLLADLTVKDQFGRPASWDEVIETLEGMEKSRAAPAPRRTTAAPQLVIKPAAKPGHVIKIKPSDHLPHHQVVASNSSVGPWIVCIVIAVMLAGGVTFKLRSLRNRPPAAPRPPASPAAVPGHQYEQRGPPTADVVKDARLYIDTFTNDIEGGRTQIREARQKLLGTDIASSLAPELDQLEQLLNERAQRETPEAAPPAVAAAEGTPSAGPSKSNTVAALCQAAGRLLERDYAGALALLPASGGLVDGIDVATLRKELAELPRWTDQVYTGLRESIGREQELHFREGARTLFIKSVTPPEIFTEKAVREGGRVIGRSGSSFRLGDLSTDELIRQLHGERGGVPALMSGLLAYRAGKLSDARAWFNRTTSPWAPLILRAMDGSTELPP